MGQKSSKVQKSKSDSQRDMKSSLQAQINNKLKAYDAQIKEKIENNYSISNFNSKSYLAYNIKKKVDSKTEDKFSWFEYAEDECELIQSQKPYIWVEQTLRLLKYMKKDAKVREFQKSSIVSLIYTIETMTDLDYLVEVPIEQYEEFFQEDELDEIVEGQINEYNKTIKRNQSVFGSGINQMDGSGSQNYSDIAATKKQNDEDNNNNQGIEIQTPVKIIEYNDIKASPLSDQYQRNQYDSSNQVSLFGTHDYPENHHTIINNQRNSQAIIANDAANENKNIRTLIERTPIFEEELEENIQGTKIDSNLMRSEVFTVMADQNTNILQYNAFMEERQQIRERNQTAITQMNNNTLLLNNAAAVAHQENQYQTEQQQQTQSIRNSDTQQSTPEDNDPYIDALKMVNFYKRISVFLEKSFDEKLNGLRALLKLYKKYFLKQYSEILFEQQKSGKMEVKESIVDEMLNDVQQFIHFFLYCVIFFYDLDNLLPQKRHSSLVNKENLWNFLINIFFSDNEVYTLCFELIQVSLIHKERSLSSKMLNLDRVLPHHLEIHPKFCLDKKTIEWQKKQNIKKKQQQQSQNVNSQLQPSSQQQQVTVLGQSVSPNNSQITPQNQRSIESSPQKQSNTLNGVCQNYIKKQNQQEQLEMLEEESEFLFNENSLSMKGSQLCAKRNNSNKENSDQQSLGAMSLQAAQFSQQSTSDKENNTTTNQAKLRDSLNRSVFKSANSGQGTSSSVVIECKQLEQQNHLSPCRENNIVKQSDYDEYAKEQLPYGKQNTIPSQKKDLNSAYYQVYQISMQDEEGKDEILEETCIPKISQCEEKDSPIIKPLPYTNVKYPSIQVSPASQQKGGQNTKKGQAQNANQKQQGNSQMYSRQSSSPQTQVRQQSENNSIGMRHRNTYKDNRSNSLDEKCPYFKAIKKLKNLQFYNSPVHKMKLLVQCFELIPECVQEFYEQSLGYQEQNLIASDDLINILVFIVLKSKCTQLNTHLKLVSSFLTKSTQQSKIGYYCTTLQIVAGYLESDKIYENVEALRSKSEYFSQTVLQMNTSFLRKSSVHQNIDITSINKIISAERLENGIQTTTITQNNCLSSGLQIQQAILTPAPQDYKGVETNNTLNNQITTSC